MNRETILHCMTTIIISFIIPCLMCGCSGRVSLSEATQARLDEDATHAEEDALQYLSEKYDMDFELKSFEPDIYMLTSDANWFVRSHYSGAWEGEFIVDGETYTIRGDISENKYMDDYQLDEIRAAYTEFMQQYFADVCSIDGVECKVDIRRDWSSNHYSNKRFFSVYYDGTNIDDCLNENGIWIELDITNAFSEEFLRSCEDCVVEFEKEYENKGIGYSYSVYIKEGEESLDYVWLFYDIGGVYYHRFDYDKWVNSDYYGKESITAVNSLSEYDKLQKFFIFKEYKYKTNKDGLKKIRFFNTMRVQERNKERF